MKVIGIQISSNEVILVVLTKEDNEVVQSKESAKFKLDDHNDSKQVKQFRDQINVAFDTIKPDKIGILSRNAKAKRMPPSPISFKLEGIIQLYEKTEIDFVWPQTLQAYFKKKEAPETGPEMAYQKDAFNVAYFLLNQN